MNTLAVFKGKNIRRTLHQNEWWFSIVDVVEALTGTERGRKYWSDLKTKLQSEGYTEVSEKIGQLKLESSDGKKYETDCATAETVIPWSASVGARARDPEAQKVRRLFVVNHDNWIPACAGMTVKQTGRRVVSKQTYLPARNIKVK